MKEKNKTKYHTVATVQKYNGNTVESNNIVPLDTYIHDGLLSCVGAGNKKNNKHVFITPNVHSTH